MCTGRVKITLLFAAVLFQFGLLDLKNYAQVKAEEAEAEDEEKQDTASEDTDKKEDTDRKEDTDETAETDRKEDTDETEDPDRKEEETSESVADGDCPRPFFREYCSDEKPCCLYTGGSYACKKVGEEGENCTQNAFAYNTRDCFCKQGLFCVDGKCTSKVPQKQREEEF